MASLDTRFWLLVLFGLYAGLKLLGFPDSHDAFGFLVICLVLYLVWRQLKFRSQLRPFLWGVLVYLTGTFLDWVDGLLRGVGVWGKLTDVGDDLFLSVGFFLIALAFCRMTLERDRLESNLYALAYRDELTGLGNRRALFEQLDGLLQSDSGTLLYVDVDHFKRVNDLHGHDVGDSVLKACAHVLSAADDGRAFRLGGDEFVLLLGSAERRLVESQIAALHAGVRGLCEQYGIALSIGMTCFSPGSVPDSDTALKLADQQMYESKRQNRQQPRNSP